jgi:hypothetical protein
MTELEKLVGISDNKLGRRKDDLDYFEFIVEEYFTKELRVNKELFDERPDLLVIFNETILIHLNDLLDYFMLKEEYEKCHRIKIIIDKIK